MRRGLPAAFAAALWAGTVSASGPMEYKSPFVDEVPFGAVIAGNIPHELDPDDLEALMVYLHLAGRFREEHAELFRLASEDARQEDPWDPNRTFPDLREEVRMLFLMEDVPRSFEVVKYVAVESSRQAADGTVHTYVSTRPIRNCQRDAYRTARETFFDRKSRYGAGSAELSRWIGAQVRVFKECGPAPFERAAVAPFDPPAKPDPDWQPLEKHDRHYQIAAAYFYNGQYLEAASRFRAIAQTPESPWRDLARYLVPRSIAREALVNENDYDRHLQSALDDYRELANDPDYLAAFPSAARQIRYLEAQRDPVAFRRMVERRIVDRPEQASPQDMRDFVYMRLQQNAWSFDAQATDFERWRHLLPRRDPTAVVEHWRERRSLPWLYLALSRAGTRLDATTLGELLQAADALPQDTPGYFNILLNRIRIRGLLGESGVVSRLVEDALKTGLGKSKINRLHLAAAEGALTWTDYFRWASVKPLWLPWTDDFARRLPPNFNRITTDTPLLSRDAARLLNRYFTPAMLLEVIDTPGLGTYQRGRLAIAGWTRAMLADDQASALKFSAYIRRNVPSLDAELAVFEEGSDKHFEAARIVFDYPAFSPWVRSDAGRVQERRRLEDGTFGGPRPLPDHVADGRSWLNWWCATSSEEDIERIRTSESELQHPRFAHYSERQLETIRHVIDHRTTEATTLFGPHVIRYAKENLDDPRVPRTLHRLVFATRHACYAAPGEISRAAHALLHEHFPESEWAEKTPHWFDGRI